MDEAPERRPIESRNTRWARAVAKWLVESSVTPNQISQLSVVFAALASLFYWLSIGTDNWGTVAFFLLAALCVQMRLVCNLLDGMVAIEGGKSTPDGPFWNEAPDRFADILILSAVGYAAGEVVLGWAACAFAVLAAYVRELGRAEGAPNNFCGPMAKPHRMAAITVGTVGTVIAVIIGGGLAFLKIALWVVALGSFLTALRRCYALVKYLRARG